MKSLIRNIIPLLILALLPCITAHSKENAVQISDAKEFVTLEALGLIDKEMPPLYENTYITRAQFASLTASLLGISNSQFEYSTTFIDVPQDYWCANQIYTLKQLGLINGANAYQFQPDTPITVEQASKILVIALGYELEAVGKYGNTLSAYTSMASNLKFIPRLNYSYSSGLKATDALYMVLQTAKTDVLQQTSFGSDPTFSSIKNETLLSINHRIFYDYGIITDNGITALNGPSAVSDKYAIINGTIVHKGDYNLLNQIGLCVDFYYKNPSNSDTNYLLYFAESESRNEKLVIPAKDLVIDHEKFSTENIVYERDGRTLNVPISALADTIVNGKAYPLFDVNTLKIHAGTMTLLNNSSTEYNVIILNEHSNMLVSSVDTANETINGRYGEILSLEDYDNVFIYDINNNPIGINEVKPDTVLSYYPSLDGTVVSLYVSPRNIEGRVDEILAHHDVTKNDYFINGTPYRLATSFSDVLSQNVQGVELPETGRSYKFYLDIDGDIAALEKTDDVYIQYAYLINAVSNTALEFSDIVEMRLFMPSGDVLDAYTTKKITINGINNQPCQSLLPLLTDISGEIEPQVIKVRLNSDGDVVEVDIASPVSSPYGYDPNTFSMDYSAPSVQYKGNNQRCFNGSYSISNSSIIFLVPDWADYDIDDLQIINPAYLTDGKNYNVTIYDADASLAANAAVIKSSSGEGFEQAIFVVDRVSTTVDKNKNSVKKISGVYGGNYVSLTERKTGVVPADLKIGDVGRISLSGSEISAFDRIASLSEDPDPFIQPIEGSLVGGAFVVIWGYLYSRSSNAISTLNPAGHSGTLISAHSLNGTAARVVVYDTAQNKVRVGNYADLATSSTIGTNGELLVNPQSTKVLVYRRMDYIRDVVVVK